MWIKGVDRRHASGQNAKKRGSSNGSLYMDLRNSQYLPWFHVAGKSQCDC